MQDIADISSPGIFPQEFTLFPSDTQKQMRTSSKICIWFPFSDQRF